ncbi:unnamed protein product [Cylindrotheca closterium]|uniref:Acyltransferase n=1 Tax=Cylindrotheca closterium TaxID=2856 RepID=A0AAD2JJA6_9STRA|nr:unnamed protein product [Cylindrotheca closterium]
MPQSTTEQNQGKSKKEQTTKQEANDERTQKTSSTQESAPKAALHHDCITTLVATLNMPPYSILICMLIYGCLLYASIQWSWIYLRTLLLLYMLHAVLLDRTAQATTKPKWVQRLQPKCNKNVFFRLTAKYFSCKLHPTSQKLDPDQSYLFAYHPHGIIGMGASLALATDASGFSTTFPGIRRSGVTLNVAFRVPFFKDWLLMNGFCSASKPTLLSRLLSSESIVLVPGGAAEALHCKPKTMRLTIRNRKGFIKLALETKAAIVPCIGFGENDIFDTIYLGDEKSGAEKSWLNPRNFLWKLQRTLYKTFSFSTPLWTHPIPIPHPIDVVVGEPIHFSGKMDQHSIDECHAQYLKALQDLYDEHKAKYGYEHVPLELL